jgi:hypothetical protein
MKGVVNPHDEIKGSNPSPGAYYQNFLASPMSTSSEPFQRTDIEVGPRVPVLLEGLQRGFQSEICIGS